MNLILLLGGFTCLVAIAMAISSGIELHRADRDSDHGRPYVLPIFVGVAYAVLKALELHDVMLRPDGSKIALHIMDDLIRTALMLCVLLLLHRRPKK